MSWFSNQFVPVAHEELLDAYSDWIRFYVDEGWEAFLLTFMFRQLPGAPAAQLAVMQDEITRVYATLATRVVRKPRSPRWSQYLPRGIFVPDRPVYKRRKMPLRDVSINNGLHMHGIMVAQPFIGSGTTRLRERLDHHFMRNIHLYLNDRLLHLHIEPITHRPGYATRYAMKALKLPAFDFDQVLILPRSLRELPTRSSFR